MSGKAVVDVVIRIVVDDCINVRTIEDSIDNFLERALCSDLPYPDLYPEGLISAKCMDTKIIHKWEE